MSSQIKELTNERSGLADCIEVTFNLLLFFDHWYEFPNRKYLFIYLLFLFLCPFGSKHLRVKEYYYYYCFCYYYYY